MLNYLFYQKTKNYDKTFNNKKFWLVNHGHFNFYARTINRWKIEWQYDHKFSIYAP